MSKKNLMPMLGHLDQRADNYFAYDKEAEAYVLAQTWHVRVHKVGTAKDQYEIVYFRAARKFDAEPTNDEIIAFAKESEAGLKEHMAAGLWTAGTEQDGEAQPFKFNKWFIKDFKEV